MDLIKSDVAIPKPADVARVFTDDADHGIVQHRLALLYGVFGAFSFGTWILGIVIASIALPEHVLELHLAPSKLLHFSFGVVSFLVWRAFRGKLRPRWTVSLLDILGSALIMLSSSIAIARSGAEFHAEFAVFAPLVLVVALRSALVPSPPRWTALVAGVSAIPAPFAAYFVALKDPAWTSELVGPRLLFVGASLWGAVVTTTAWIISTVVYGLRAEIKKATKLGQYTLEDKIGEGGMGVVYRARHALLRRPTAVKLLSPDRNSPLDVRRFEREVQLTSMLSHPNTVAIYDFGHTHDGVFFYAMEHLEGISLHDLVERDGAQSPGRVIRILLQLTGALAEAHAVGLVHRDVKPANVFLCERGGIPDFVKVLDFGLVKHAGHTDPKLSRADVIAGTPHYMAPESITDPETVDARVDIYAVGAVGYFLLTGATVFEGHNLVEICSHHLHSRPEPPSRRATEPCAALEKVILQCLEKSRDDRPPSASALGALLRECPSDWTETGAEEWWRRERRSRNPSG